MATQRRSLWSEAAVDGDRGNGGLCLRRSLSTEAALGWRDNDAKALSTMASLADDGGGNCGGCCQLCSRDWCCRHQPFKGVYSTGKDAIAAAAINCRFYQGQLLLLLLTATITTATQSLVNGNGGISRRRQQW
jgi:hypothetical protein